MSATPSCTQPQHEPEEALVPTEALLSSALQKSDALHARVRKFAQAQFVSSDAPASESESFDELALDIARFQYDFSPGFARCVAAKNHRLQVLEDIPVIPSDIFRLTRVGIHPRQLDVARFETSGTTGSFSGFHPVRTMATKQELTLLQANHTLFKEHKRALVVALASPIEGNHSSSLSHMMELFMNSFDGRALRPDPEGVRYDSRSAERWLLNSQGIELEGLARAAKIGIHRSEPLFILTTSFALMAAIEALDGERIRTPSRTFIMLTGGFKGRKHTLNEAELRAAASISFQIPAAHICGEYGMTELTSQLFEEGASGLYAAPPWLRVEPVHPHNYSPVQGAEPGLAHFIDLGNIDSCLSIVTQDLIRKKDGKIELLGRAPQAPIRGCSLPFEGLLAPSLSSAARASKTNRALEPHSSPRQIR